MTPATRETIRQYWEGLRTEREVLNVLECYQVRGAFRNDGHFIGYDYAHQEWIDTREGGQNNVIHGETNH